MLLKKSIVVFLLLCLVGCYSPISEGTVIEKQFFPAYDDTSVNINPMNNQIEISGGWNPERWSVTIKNRDESDRWRTREVDVTDQEWNKIKLGDWHKVK